jgi:hypothetical protein
LKDKERAAGMAVEAQQQAALDGLDEPVAFVFQSGRSR